jgi:hypothetical protein
MAQSPDEQLAALSDANRRLRAALEGLICWIGEPPDGPSWASPEAKQRNRRMFDAAMRRALDCFPTHHNSTGVAPPLASIGGHC